jgi:glyoxylase-like metal-dependent hydrolase (beta-lactamase superfamily II)
MALQASPPDPGRPPRRIRPGLWLFAPSRDSQGGSSWLLEGEGEQPALLVDCPALTQANLTSLQRFGSNGAIVLTSREGHGRCRRFQEQLGWPVWVQEQEAYLLPGVERLQTWSEEMAIGDGRLLWTPGPTPGAAVLAILRHGLDLLFCGRLLLPTTPGRLAPLRTARTFHWPRQLRSVERLRRWLPAGSPAWIACGGGLGALRGEVLVPHGAALLTALELTP